MTDSLQTVVAKAIRNELPASLGPYAGWTYDDIANASADVALTAALSWLAAEAKRREAMQGSPMFYENSRWYSVSDWLESQIPPGQEGDDV